MSGCPATLMMFGRVHACDWTEPHTGHAHHNHDVNVTWTGATDDADPDDDPQTIRAAFDAAPKGVTAHPMVRVSGVRYHPDAMDTAHAEIRELTRQRDDARDLVARSGYFIDCEKGAGRDCVMWHSAGKHEEIASDEILDGAS